MPPFNPQTGGETQTSPRVPQRGQLQYPLDLESEGALKYSLENVLKDVIVRRNRIQTTLLSGATSFEVASSYMVMTAQAAVTITTIKGGREGMILTLQFGDANITITDTGTGAADTINLETPFVSSANDVIQLLHDGVSWREVGRSVGAASTTESGTVELATDAETHTGTDTSRVLTSSNITSIIKRVYKSADEIVNNSDVLQNDDHLLFAVGANEVWAFRAVVFSNSSGVADIQFKWSVPAGTTMMWESPQVSSFAVDDETTTNLENGLGANAFNIYDGVIFVSATAGNVTLQWAQNTAEVSDTKVLKGSYIIAHRLA